MCHGGVWHCWQPCTVVGTWPGHVCGCWQLGPDGEGGAGLPSALLGSISAFGTKAGAFPRPSAGAWKAVSCLQALHGCHGVGLGSRWPLRLLLEELMVSSAFHLPVKAESALTLFLFFPSSSWLSWRTTQIPLMRHRWQVARQGWRR